MSCLAAGAGAGSASRPLPRRRCRSRRAPVAARLRTPPQATAGWKPSRCRPWRKSRPVAPLAGTASASTTHRARASLGRPLPLPVRRRAGLAERRAAGHHPGELGAVARSLGPAAPRVAATRAAASRRQRTAGALSSPHPTGAALPPDDRPHAELAPLHDAHLFWVVMPQITVIACLLVVALPVHLVAPARGGHVRPVRPRGGPVGDPHAHLRGRSGAHVRLAFLAPAGALGHRRLHRCDDGAGAGGWRA